MYQTTSENFHKFFSSYGRDITAKVYFNGAEEVGGVREINATLAFDSNDGISIGSTCSSRCTIRIYKPDYALPLRGGYFVPYIGAEIADPTTTAIPGAAVSGLSIVGTQHSSYSELVPLGVFYIPDDGITDLTHSWEITGYDKMSQLTDTYTPKVAFPATPGDMLGDICAQIGIEAPYADFPDIEIEGAYEGTIRQQLGWLAGLCGKSARFDRDGNLVFCWYQDCEFQIGRKQQYMGQLTSNSDGLFSVSSLTTGTEGNPIVSGTGQGIAATNPYMTQEAADSALESLRLSYAPITAKWRCDPSVDVGDIVSVERSSGEWVSVCIMELDIHYNGGLSSTLKCYAADDADYAVESPTEQKIRRQYQNLEKAMQDATARIIGAKGGYYEITLDEQGLPTGWTIRDTPAIGNTTRMWIMSSGGLGYSKDGGKTVSGVALTMDGQINADIITAGQMSAERVTVSGQTLSDFIDASIDDDGHPVLRIGASDSEIILKEYNDRIGFYNTDGDLLAYWNNNSFELVELSKFRLGPMAITVQPNRSISFVGVDN